MLTPDEIPRTALKTHTRTFGGVGTIYYLLPKGPRIIAMNHTPLVLDEITYFMMQHNLFYLPLVGPLLKLSGQIPVKRDSTQSRDSLTHAYRARKFVYPTEDQKAWIGIK